MSNYGVSVNDAFGQHSALSSHTSHGGLISKILVVCNQQDTAPVWGYILHQHRLEVILETSLEKAFGQRSDEITDMIVLDINVSASDRANVYRKFREQSVAPLLLLLPAYDENQILDAYAAGVDDVVVKPISPPVFLSKIRAWMRRSWTVPVHTLNLLRAGEYKLDPSRHCLITSESNEVRLTNLEFRLLHLLMSRPGQIFSAEEMIESIWGGYGEGDQVLLKNVVYRLRKKIEADPGHPVHLQTWPGGYSFPG